jgi:hypothetical protein
LIYSSLFVALLFQGGFPLVASQYNIVYAPLFLICLIQLIGKQVFKIKIALFALINNALAAILVIFNYYESKNVPFIWISKEALVLLIFPLLMSFFVQIIRNKKCIDRYIILSFICLMIFILGLIVEKLTGFIPINIEYKSEIFIAIKNYNIGLENFRNSFLALSPPTTVYPISFLLITINVFLLFANVRGYKSNNILVQLITKANWLIAPASFVITAFCSLSSNSVMYALITFLIPFLRPTKLFKKKQPFLDKNLMIYAGAFAVLILITLHFFDSQGILNFRSIDQLISFTNNNQERVMRYDQSSAALFADLSSFLIGIDTPSISTVESSYHLSLIYSGVFGLFAYILPFLYIINSYIKYLSPRFSSCIDQIDSIHLDNLYAVSLCLLLSSMAAPHFTSIPFQFSLALVCAAFCALQTELKASVSGKLSPLSPVHLGAGGHDQCVVKRGC